MSCFPKLFFFKNISSLLLLLLVFSKGQAQNNPGDLLLLETHETPALTAGYNGRTDTINNKVPVQYRNKKAVAKLNPFRWLATGSMFFYQQVMSPQINAGCLYQRTCSNYSKAAISYFGLIRGILLTADRLTRCTSGVIPEIEAYRFDEHGHVADEPTQYLKK